MLILRITGATGYIGGDVLHALTTEFASASIVALVRSEKQSELLKPWYPQVTSVVGDLDSEDTIAMQSADADIVINAANNKHCKSVESITVGFTRHAGGRKRYLLQISGVSVLSSPDIQHGTYGEASSKVFDDVRDSSEILELIKGSPARQLDQTVLRIGEDNSEKIGSALVFAPMIYGQGRAPGNTRSIQIPTLFKLAVEKKQSYDVGRGEAA